MKEKQIEEMAGIILASYTPRHAAENLYNVGYRKQSEGEWIKKHRHRGGFRTVTGVDCAGETHTITIDTRCEYDELYCSLCGKQSADNFLNFCPNCGAKMDRERKEKRDDQEM